MGNFSRDTFDPRKHYTSVHLQQGVPLIDADWNEADDIRMFEAWSFFAAYLGDGTPQGAPGFACAPADAPENDFAVRARSQAAFAASAASLSEFTKDTGAPGLLLVDGRVARIFADASYAGQSLYENEELAERWGVPVLPALTTPDQDRRDLVYLDLWSREVDALEDEDLPNPLIGVETTVRRRREWVVRVAEDETELPEAPPGHAFAVLARLERSAGEERVDTIVDLRAPIAVPLNLFFETQGRGVGVSAPPGGDRFRVTTDETVLRCDDSGVVVSDSALSSQLKLQAENGAGVVRSLTEPPLPIGLQMNGGNVAVGRATAEAKLDVGVDCEWRGPARVEGVVSADGPLHLTGPVALTAPWPEPEVLNRERPVFTLESAPSDGMIVANIFATRGVTLRGESPPDSIRAAATVRAGALAFRLEPVEGLSGSGLSACISAPYAMVQNIVDPFKVSVLRRGPDGRWLAHQQLSDPRGDRLGYAMVVDGDHALLGVRTGAQPFRLDRETRLWQPAPARLNGPDLTSPLDRKGIAMNGRVALLRGDASGRRRVLAYRFTNSEWTELPAIGSDLISEPVSSMAVDGARALVGCAADAKIYFLELKNDAWRITSSIHRPEHPEFGRHVSLSGDRAMAGTLNASAATIYEFAKESWRPMRDFVFEDPASNPDADTGEPLAIIGRLALLKPPGRDVYLCLYEHRRRWLTLYEVPAPENAAGFDLKRTHCIIASLNLQDVYIYRVGETPPEQSIAFPVRRGDGARVAMEFAALKEPDAESETTAWVDWLPDGFSGDPT